MCNDTIRYESILDKARSTVDAAIAKDVYMLLSNMFFKLGNIESYNNKQLITDANVKICVINQYINIMQKIVYITKQKPSHHIAKSLLDIRATVTRLKTSTN